MKKIICFDMDGTIADLYNVNGWLEMLHREEARPYLEAEPMWDMVELRKALELHRQAGNEIRVITWLAMNSTNEYKEVVREAKKVWLEKWDFLYDNFHAVQYGATKADSIRKVCKNCEAILIDDNEKVRKGWKVGRTIDPTKCNLVETLLSLL